MNLALPEKILKDLQPWLISVVETGSQTIPWIQGARDRDIVFYVQHKNSSPEIRYFNELRTHYKPNGECWIPETIPDRKYLFGYEYHFMRPIWGTEVPPWDIFEPIMQERVKRFLVYWAKTHRNDLKSKLWYHALTEVYLLQNGDYFLTPEQQINVQNCHDRAMTPEIHNFIVQELNKYAQELGLVPIE